MEHWHVKTVEDNKHAWAAEATRLEKEILQKCGTTNGRKQTNFQKNK